MNKNIFKIEIEKLLKEKNIKFNHIIENMDLLDYGNEYLLFLLININDNDIDNNIDCNMQLKKYNITLKHIIEKSNLNGGDYIITIENGFYTNNQLWFPITILK